MWLIDSKLMKTHTNIINTPGKIASNAAYHPKNTETKQIAEIAAFAVGKQNITIFNLTFVLNARADAPTISLFPTI